MKDNYTVILTDKINDWGLDRIYDMEDHISDLEACNKAHESINYLKDIHFSMPLGLALRRYMCERYSEGFDEESRRYSFNLDGKAVYTGDYTEESYDIENDDLTAYIEIFTCINNKYNTDSEGNLSLNFTKAEIRRQLRATSGCVRKKMFELSFALHMQSEDTAKFLTDVLAEQTYNYREPEEIIADFCQSHEEYNHYYVYTELCNLFEAESEGAVVNEGRKENYTAFAKSVKKDIETKDELLEFLLANTPNFYAYSETAYNSFVSLYAKASSMLLASESGISHEGKSVDEKIESIKRDIADGKLINPEQLAREMLACIPRATTKRYKDGKKIISNDFIKIYNGENGLNGNKIKTTELPKRITMNLPVSDRLWDLIRRDKAVDRKDLVFMKFYVFSLYLQEKDGYSADDYFEFTDECNYLLVRCGMSRLYPGNRFENLIMLSLLASNPFEMFENIIEFSFINEPEADTEE